MWIAAAHDLDVRDLEKKSFTISSKDQDITSCFVNQRNLLFWCFEFTWSTNFCLFNSLFLLGFAVQVHLHCPLKRCKLTFSILLVFATL